MYSILCITVMSLYAPCDNINTLRDDYFAIRTEEQVFSFLSKYQSNSCHQSIPYVASIVMRQADYLSSPFKKYGCYKDGKAMLEQYIKAHPENLEARSIRVLVQLNLPSFLDYHDNIDADILYINKHMDQYHLDDKYKKIIRNQLKK